MAHMAVHGYWEAFPYALLDLLRYLAWYLVCGLIMAGTWYGGHAAYAAWRRTGPPPLRRRVRVAREASRGISEIETFLAECAQPRPPTGENGQKPAVRDWPAADQDRRDDQATR